MTTLALLNKSGCVFNRNDYEEWDETAREIFKNLHSRSHEYILISAKFAEILKSGIDMTRYDQMIRMGTAYDLMKKHYEYVSMDHFHKHSITFGEPITPVYIEINADEFKIPRFSDFLTSLHVFSETYSRIEIDIGGQRVIRLKVMPGETKIDVNIPICSIQYQDIQVITVSGKVSKFRLDFLNLDTKIRKLLFNTDNIVDPFFEALYGGGSGISRYAPSYVLGFDNSGMLKYVDTHSTLDILKKFIKNNREYYPEHIKSITSDYFFKPEYIGFYSEDNQKRINSFYENAKSENCLLNILPMEMLDLIMTEYTNVFNIFHYER